MEIWKDVVGYEGLYKVSNLGNVKSVEKVDRRGWHRQEKQLLLQNNKTGYLQVGLRINGKERKFLVHRLVAMAFLENTNNYEMVNHKNCIKNDNRVENLEWCDEKYNSNYADAQKRRIANTDFSKRKYNPIVAIKNMKPIAMCDMDGNILKTFSSVKQAIEEGYGTNSISSCLTGKLKTHRGHKWMAI